MFRFQSAWCAERPFGPLVDDTEPSPATGFNPLGARSGRSATRPRRRLGPAWPVSIRLVRGAAVRPSAEIADVMRRCLFQSAWCAERPFGLFTLTCKGLFLVVSIRLVRGAAVRPGEVIPGLTDLYGEFQSAWCAERPFGLGVLPLMELGDFNVSIRLVRGAAVRPRVCEG
jgi:hypothetical protein